MGIFLMLLMTWTALIVWVRWVVDGQAIKDLKIFKALKISERIGPKRQRNALDGDDAENRAPSAP